MTNHLPEQPSNFADLKQTEPLLAELGGYAECYCLTDPNTALMKMRQFAELLTQTLASKTGKFIPHQSQFDRIQYLSSEGILPEQVKTLLHEIRDTGNKANHRFTGEISQAHEHLKYTWIVGVWFIRTVHDPQYRCGEFIEPSNQTALLQEHLEETRRKLASAEQRLLEQQATPADLKGLLERFRKAAQAAEKHINLSEAETRQIIDRQLHAAGWEADSVRLHYGQGTRPEQGRNLVIAEWPTSSGPADYAFFIGMRPVAVAEAKSKKRSVYGSLEQSARYSKGFRLDQPAGLEMPNGPWEEYRIPFLYATNGRPYISQLKAECGIWFRDARRNVNQSHPLSKWHRPEELLQQLEQNHQQADQELENDPLDYQLKLRHYQKKAIRAIESQLAAGKRELLLAMATGTGKTKTAIALIYRLLHRKRFRRVLFLVDRKALGEQASNDFKTVRLKGTRTFADTFGLTDLKDRSADKSTEVHVTTVQGMVKEVLSENPPPIGTYDLILVDEAHRGYNLDRELDEAELGWRDEQDYVSTYRQVLEHFDAVKIALTATPALHTTQIFGMPVFTYSYREAVLDGFLVDHEPPILIHTELSTQGITWDKGQDIPTYTPGDDQVELFTTPDEISLKVEQFNKKVIAQGFNRTVCAELAQKIDPFDEEKTLIFCVNDRHADEVVDLLKESLRAIHGEINEALVAKITGKSDRPGDLIRSFRNEQLPNIAVTVDLLTTGIDIPKIVNLVFLRRVNSRILFEQMLGRATRLAPDIGKTCFRIYDAVGAYDAVSPFSTMQGVVTKPKRTFTELAHDAFVAPTPEARSLLRDEVVAKLQRVKQQLTQVARDTFEGETGETVEEFIQTLKTATGDEAAELLQKNSAIMQVLDDRQTKGGQYIFISDHEDRVISTRQAYPTGDKHHEDYLTSFQNYIQEQRDQLPALIAVLTKPSSLSYEELKKLRTELDNAGFSEKNLQTAYKNAKQVDVATTIIGYIRAAANDESPESFEDRVDAAMKRLLNAHSWSKPQEKWLERLVKQLKANGLLDPQELEKSSNPIYQQIGGFEKLNKNIFNGELGDILIQLQEDVWGKDISA